MVPFIETRGLEEEAIEWLVGADNEFSLGPGYRNGHQIDGFSLSHHSLCDATFLSGSHSFIKSVVHAKNLM